MKSITLSFLTINPIARSVFYRSCICFIVISLTFGGSSMAAVSFTVEYKTLGSKSLRANATDNSTTSEGSVAFGSTVNSSGELERLTYTVTGADLTSVGGIKNETIAFDILFSDGAQFNTVGNISITGRNYNQIDRGEALTATLALNAASTTFNNTITLSFIKISAG